MENKKFIKINENNFVTFIHYMPFDSVYGMNLDEKELMSIGILIDEIPEKNKTELTEGQNVALFYNKELERVEYKVIENTQISTHSNTLILEDLQKQVGLLQEQVAVLEQKMIQ